LTIRGWFEAIDSVVGLCDKRIMADTKEHAHELIDRLPPERLSAVVGLLEAMLDEMPDSLVNAPEDDEELTPEMAAAIERARASLARGEGIPHEEILREFGVNTKNK
jgi:hypothetical protein